MAQCSGGMNSLGLTDLLERMVYRLCSVLRLRRAKLPKYEQLDVWSTHVQIEELGRIKSRD